MRTEKKKGKKKKHKRPRDATMVQMYQFGQNHRKPKRNVRKKDIEKGGNKKKM